MGQLRSLLKRVGEAALARGAAPLAARRVRAGTLILAYHNVRVHGSAPAGDQSLHLDFDRFRRQLDLLGERARVVALGDTLAPDPGDRPRVAITFDDAYRGALTLALPELAAREWPATVFVAPGLLGGVTPWWDALAAWDGLAPGLRHEALYQARGRDGMVRELARTRGLRPVDTPADCRIADQAEVEAACALPGMTIGAHTWSHPNLAALPVAELPGELARPMAWLEARYERVIPWLAYPYGLTNPAVELAAAEAGYQAALLVSGGWIRPGGTVSSHAIPRLNVPAGLSADGFGLRLAGLFAA